MFDIGFWELLIIGVVALLVIGPDKLPGLARTAGHWVGRGRRFVASVKADIDREIAADELKNVLAKQAESNPLHEIVEETKRTIADTHGQVAGKTKESGEAVTKQSDDQSRS
ncbi:MAG: Sec-independent protein translocase protein TatB [Thiogranum sp.]|nr:Sec-independent protein translocase protein TatB [Thiogranum sp.]